MSCIDCAFSRKITRSKLINSSVLSNLCVCVDSRLAVNRLSYGVWCARFDLFLFISFFYSLHGTFFGGGSLSCSVAFVMCVALRRGEFTSMSRHDMHVTYQWQAGINQSECAWIVLLVLVLIQISTFSSVSPDFVFFFVILFHFSVGDESRFNQAKNISCEYSNSNNARSLLPENIHLLLFSFRGGSLLFCVCAGAASRSSAAWVDVERVTNM